MLTIRRFLRHKAAVVSLILIAGFAVVALFTDQLVLFTNHAQSALINKPPGTLDETSNLIHWLGTDDLGRDIFTRLLYGTRVSLVVGLTADAIIVTIGILIGLTAGYFGGSVDNLLMRFTDIMYAFPGLLFAMVVVATLGHSIPAVLIALGAANWVTMARLVRGQVLQTRQMDYVLSARAIGGRSAGIIVHHILPNIVGPIIALATLTIPGIITAEAALAFLGVGIDPSLPTLGRLISSGMDNIFSHPSEIMFPVLMLTALTLAFTLISG